MSARRFKTNSAVRLMIIILASALSAGAAATAAYFWLQSSRVSLLTPSLITDYDLSYQGTAGALDYLNERLQGVSSLNSKAAIVAATAAAFQALALGLSATAHLNQSTSPAVETVEDTAVLDH